MPVDYLVNCAGTTTLEPFVDVTVEAFDHLIAVNTRAPLIISQEYAQGPHRKGVGGAIVNVSSNVGFYRLCQPRRLLRLEGCARRDEPGDGQ